MRKVHLRSYVLYLASAWGFLQALDFFSGKFGLSSLLFNYGLILLSAGLLALFTRNQFETRRGGRLFSKAELVINTSILILALMSCVLISTGKPANKSKSAHQSPKPKQPQALEHFLKAKYFLNLTDDVSQIDSAANHLEQSLRYEPEIALTHAMLSQAYTRKLFYVDPSQTWAEKAFVEAERAFALDSSSAYAWFARGFANWTPLHKFPHAECIRDYKKSITIDPGFDEAHNQLGLVLSHVGLINESLEEFTRCIQLNSANDVARSNLVRTYFFDQQHQRVIEEFKRIPPSLYNVSYRLSQYANSLLHVGDYAGALAVIDKTLEQKPNDFAMNAQKAIYYILNHQPQLAIPHLQIAEQGAVQPTGHFHHTSYDIATAYALLDQSEKALHWVNWSIENGFACYPAYSRDEFLTNLKNNSGFQKIIEDLHQTQAQMAEVLEEE